MKQLFRILAATCAALLIAAVALTAAPAEETDGPEYSVVRVPVSKNQVWVLRSANGPEIYGEFCAECHGANGHGNPIAAVALGAPVPNLTELEDPDKPGQFAKAYVKHVLDSRCDSVHHKTTTGAQTMPCWRQIMRRALKSDAHATIATASLVNHLESFQN
jgi:mono/diheme cytochrome c family protein